MITFNSIAHEKNRFNDDDLVCYCFEYTKKDIESDFIAHGYSKILEKIKTEKKNRRCNCEVKNPRGR